MPDPRSWHTRASHLLRVLLSVLALVAGRSEVAAASVQIEKILAYGLSAPVAHSVDRVRLDGGALAVEYETQAPDLADRKIAIGIFGTSPEMPDLLDDHTIVPGCASPCDTLWLGGFSEGRIFFWCDSAGAPDAVGTWAWDDEGWTPLVTMGTGVPGCSGSLSNALFALDDENDVVPIALGKALLPASTLDGSPDGCFADLLADPGGGVTAIGSNSSPYPADLGTPSGPGGGAALGPQGAAFQWTFSYPEEGIFVDRGNGLETFAATSASFPRFDSPGARFEARMRWTKNGLVFHYIGDAGHEGLFRSDGSSIVPIVEQGMIAPDTGQPFESISSWDAAGDSVVFEAYAGGNGANALYVWRAGEISLVARPEMSLPGGTEPITSFQSRWQLSDQLLFFVAAFGTADARLYALDAHGPIEIARGSPADFDLRDADGRQLVYGTYDGQNTILYRATVGSRDLPALAPGSLVVVIALLAGSGRAAWRSGRPRNRAGTTGRGA